MAVRRVLKRFKGLCTLGSHTLASAARGPAVYSSAATGSYTLVSSEIQQRECAFSPPCWRGQRQQAMVEQERRSSPGSQMQTRIRAFASAATPWGGQRHQATPELAMRLKTLGVVGAGQMGSGIAQLGAMAGMEVVLVDLGEGALERAMHRIQSSLDRLAKKEQFTQDECESAVARIRCSQHLEELGGSDFVVEAVAESEGLKRDVFERLDDVTPPHAILASNTSSISITVMGAATTRPGKVIGMHFMNPPPIMSLVEIVNGIATDPETSKVTESLATRMGKTVCFARDYPGFIVNRLLMPMINEAFYALLEGVGTAEDIDIGMKLGTNQPMGPLTLADFIGLDTCVAIMRVLHTRLGDAKYRPCPLLVQYVDAGWLGRKSGRGVYLYREE